MLTFCQRYMNVLDGKEGLLVAGYICADMLEKRAIARRSREKRRGAKKRKKREEP